jgi:GH25 family lysozyme M1 (1,4-beta-N-acetylmuramidase)
MRGVDVHQDKGNPDWRRAFTAGARFAWLKVSEGAGGHPNEKILPWYTHNRPAAKAAGIRVGGYHFLTTGIAESTPKEEAEFFLSRLVLNPGDLLPACDFEQEPPDVTQTLAFLRFVEQEIGVKPLLYLNSDFLDRGLAGASPAERQALKQFPLWFADYGANDGTDHGIRHNTHGFKVLAHQFTSQGRIQGVAAPTDLNELKAPSLDGISFKPAVAAGHSPPWELVVAENIAGRGRLANPLFVRKVARALRDKGRVVLREPQ